MAAQGKQFIDTFGGVWFDGRLPPSPISFREETELLSVDVRMNAPRVWELFVETGPGNLFAPLTRGPRTGTHAGDHWPA